MPHQPFHPSRKFGTSAFRPYQRATECFFCHSGRLPLLATTGLSLTELRSIQLPVGTTLLDLMKLDVIAGRSALVDNQSARRRLVRGPFRTAANLRSARLASMSMFAANPDVQRTYRVGVGADALKLAASPQLRNMATFFGVQMLQAHALQLFSAHVSTANCNKRNPAPVARALEGF